MEPRTPDGREVLDEFSVIWAPKMTPVELTHLKQTNPAVIGMARLGERRGVRVAKDQAQAIHAIVRPEATYLPSGPKVQYVAGPFPWGIDRSAITKGAETGGLANSGTPTYAAGAWQRLNVACPIGGNTS